MPKAVEQKLKRTALRKFGSTTSERARAYIYGTLRHAYNWTPKREKHKDKD